MTDKPPPAAWAIQRAKEEGGSEGYTLSFARYIEKHEQPPVDPDLLDVRRILAALLNPYSDVGKECLAGDRDDYTPNKRALAEYKKIKGERG